MNPSPYLALRVGDRYGRYAEPIQRRELRTLDEPAPPWFTPTQREGHLGIKLDGYALYLELDIDDEARYNDHPFADVEALTTVQLGFVL